MRSSLLQETASTTGRPFCRACPGHAWRPSRKRMQTVAFSGDAVGLPGGNRVTLSFALPYRCNFGQHLCLVGSAEPLGSWQVEKGVHMRWSQDDVWLADLEVPASSPTGTVLEYKYVVREGDGGVVQWKPGENFTLRVPLGEGEAPLPECVKIRDAWDGALRQIEVEANGSATKQTLPPSLEPPPPLDPAALAARGEEALSAEADAALASLDAAIKESARLREQTDDPSAPAVLEADRAIAAAARKAMTLSRALAEVRDVDLLE